MAEKELDYLLKRYNELVSDIDDIESTIEVCVKSCQKYKKSHR